MKKPIKLTESDLHEMVKKSVDVILAEQVKIQEEWEKRRETLRRQLTIEKNRSQRVMERYYGIPSNPYKPMLLEKITLDRIIKKHGDNGYIIISANRSDKEQEVNDKATQSLILDLKRSGYSYLPLYGGYRDTKTGVEDSFEPSFLVFNYLTNGDEQPFQNLKNLAIEWCGKYDQASVLVKDPSQPPVWLDAQGNVVSNRSSNKVWKNDPTQEYFTSMKPRHKVDQNNVSRRFTLDIQEIYANPIPCTLNEERIRKGEIMLWR